MKTKPVIYQHPELDGRSFFLEGDSNKSTGLLFIHGFTATTVEVRQIANYYNKLGYTVAGPLLSGHGGTPESMNKIRLQDWLNDVENAYDHLKSKTENVIVFGESMGALLSLYLAYIHPEILSLFVFSPALKIKGLWKSLLVWPFISFTYKKNTDNTMLWQGYNVVPLRAATQLLKLQRMVKKILPALKNDVFVFIGKKDKTIDLNGGLLTYSLLGSTKKEIIWLDESSHCILLDQELEKAIDICSSKIIK